MNPTAISYQSYMLRLWQEKSHGEWRASLSNVDTGELRYFPNITTLFAYLCKQVDQPILGSTKIDQEEDENAM